MPRPLTSDNAIIWVGGAVALLAAIILDKGTAPHKWHAAIVWTTGAFGTALVFGRQKWNSWLFWAFWTVCLALHGFAMWLIFKQLLPRLVLGTLYVSPLAVVEGIFLFLAFLSLDNKLRTTK